MEDPQDVAAQGAVEGADEHELRHRIRTVRVGIWLTLAAAAATISYAVATPGEPHRAVIALTATLAIVSAVVLDLLPTERIIRSRWREVFFISWSLADILMVSVVVLADGGVDSPLGFLFFLPLLFGTLSYPLAVTIALGVLNLGAFLLCAALEGDDAVLTGFGAFVLTCAAALTSWESQGQGLRRRRLAEALTALEGTAAVDRMRARQQEQVARFGQRALRSIDLEYLAEDAAALVADVMEVETCTVFKLDPENRKLKAIAAAGVPEDFVSKLEVPAGPVSQAGYTLTIGNPVIVTDWAAEERFPQPAVSHEAGLMSGITVVVQQGSQPYGVLSAQSRRPRDYGRQDINFLEAIANVLGHAIERRDREERIRWDALHDPLTGLANRSLFLDRLDQALARAVRSPDKVAVLFLDLDQFKRINDSLGHGAGDELLAMVAPRITAAVRPGDTVARFGGDEFTVLVEGISSDNDTSALVSRIRRVLSRPFEVLGSEHFVSTSIGIAIGDGTETPEDLIRDADAALYEAKEHGRGRDELFDSTTRTRLLENLEIENDLRRAVEREQLCLHYQPVVRIEDRAIVTFEALVRWNHPARGLLGPGAFIPLAEDSNLIHAIGAWVLREACARAAEWQSLTSGREPIAVAVNLSARQLTEPGLVETVSMALAATGLPPAALQLELTESVLMDDSEAAEASLRALADLGVRIALDDFGSGFSSLGYLKRLPLTTIKLDRVFIDALEPGSTDAAIVSAVVALADSFDLGVVAEGVETNDQLETVSNLGCGFVQGFHFSKPVPDDEVDALVGSPPWLQSLQRAS